MLENYNLIVPRGVLPQMTASQPHLAIGVPALRLAAGIMGNGLPDNTISVGMSSLESHMLALEAGLSQRIDDPAGKAAEFDDRLGVPEDRWKR
jgi:hypothetical protein